MSVGGCVYECRLVCMNVGRCVRVWVGVYECGLVCMSVGWCVRECRREYLSPHVFVCVFIRVSRCMYYRKDAGHSFYMSIYTYVVYLFT